MGKNKLKKFKEMETFPNVIHASSSEMVNKDHELKGKWGLEIFKNKNPIVLELGCGKGEYTVGMAQKFADKNFIGVDIKGARMWKGAKEAIENNLENAAFLRTRIELIKSFFSENEVSEIWLTFPDPQLKKKRKKKRLSSSTFLNAYRAFLPEGGIVQLKTDNYVLYTYTKHLVEYNNLEIEVATDDLYGCGLANDILEIKTFYEKQYLAQGYKINYIRFKLPKNREIIEFPEDDEQ